MKTYETENLSTETGPFDGSSMNPTARIAANAQLRRAEELVDLVGQGASKVWAIALLIAHGFNLMRHKVIFSDAGAASTRLVG